MYPEKVENTSEEIYQCFEESLIEETNRESSWYKPIVIDVINKFLFPKFIDGEELLLFKEEVNILYKECIVEMSLQSLKERGMIDMMENEDGEEMIFLTENGKIMEENLRKE